MEIYRVECSMFERVNGGEKALGLQNQWMICRKIEGAYHGLEQQRLTFLGKDSKSEPSGIPAGLRELNKCQLLRVEGRTGRTILTMPVSWLGGSIRKRPRKSGCGSNGDSAELGIGYADFRWLRLADRIHVCSLVVAMMAGLSIARGVSVTPMG